MPNSKQTVIFIKGTFQFLDEPHVSSIISAISECDYAVFAIEEADRPTSIYDPFNYAQRIAIILETLKDVKHVDKIEFTPIKTQGYDTEALQESVVKAVLAEIDFLEEAHNTSFDYKLAGFNDDIISALPAGTTAMKADVNLPDRFEEIKLIERYLEEGSCLEPVAPFLMRFRNSHSYESLQKELMNKRAINAQYGTGPFHTADAVCLYNGKVLVIHRGNSPFKDMMALPGGMVDAGENFQDASIRELIEETEISVNGRRLTEDEIRNCIARDEPLTVDHPLRDPRGHYIAHAVVFDFSHYDSIPMVYGADDALDASWHDIGDLRPRRMAFDHFAILHAAIGAKETKPEKAWLKV